MTASKESPTRKQYHVTHSKGSMFLPLYDPDDGTVPKVPIDRGGHGEPGCPTIHKI